MIEHGNSSFDYRSIREIAANAGAGATAGAIAATFVCPLDVIKTRLQVLGLPETPASGQRGGVIITSLKNIVKNEGFRGMYRGLSPTIIALLPNWAVYFSVYGKLKDVLQSSGWFSLLTNLFVLWFFLRLTGVSDIFAQITYTKSSLSFGLSTVLIFLIDGNLSIGSNMVAAAGAGAATSIATNPLWVVKTRLMTQGIRPDVVPYKSVMSAFSRICHEEGLRGLYSGILPSLAGVSHVAIQFPAYEKIKQYMAKMDNTSVENLSPGNVAIASSIAKVIASVLTYPHEVIRAKLQEQGQMRNAETKYSGVIDCIKKVLRSEGIPGMYRGCATNLIRTTPSAVITFTTYEMMLRFFRQVVPPETNNSEDHKREEERKSLGSRRGEEEKKDMSLRESQTQSNKISTPPIPLGSK